MGCYTDGMCVLLLDVAFNGSFPFHLIEKIKSTGHKQHKIILLSSVYNCTAYKKRPETLYGADAYLELHHIGDRLLQVLGELYPAVASQTKLVPSIRASRGERPLGLTDISEQADSLAKLLVADIVLYHQDLMEQGVVSGQLNQLFAEQLAEGRRLLFARLPEAKKMSIDFIRQAFDSACRAYVSN